MKARTILIIIFTIIGRVALGQTTQGHYEGALTRDGSVQLISINFDNDKVTYDIPEIGYYDVASEKLFWSKDTLNLKIYYGSFYCFVDKNTGDVTGISKKWDPKIRLHLKHTDEKIKQFAEEEIQFSNSSVSLSGVLFKPFLTGKVVPYVILIHGSDYQDRNTPYYHSLGYSLATKGIGVLLYDKRGCGKSTGKWETSDFSDFANDAVSALQYLKNRKDLNISKIGFLGTSQGGWIAPIAANQTTDCAFVILNVGPSVSVFEQDLNRVQYSMTEDGLEKATIDSAIDYSKLYFKYVQTNNLKDWKSLEKFGSSIKDKSWVEYVNLPKNQNDEDINWWRKNDFNPSQNLKNIKCKVLSIFGGKDILVPPQENKSKMDSLLKLSGVKYKIININNCGHDMLSYAGLNGDNWNWPVVYWKWRKQPIEFIDSIVDWIKN